MVLPRRPRRRNAGTLVGPGKSINTISGLLFLGMIVVGREIRRGPKGWKHPRGGKGGFLSMHDQDHGSAAREWLARLKKWESGKDPNRKKAGKDGIRYYWDWDAMPPDKERYRPKFDSKPVCYQIYETVSEGTPMLGENLPSPVFETLKRLIDWLVEQGYSRAVAEKFAEQGNVPSAVITSRGDVKMDLRSLED